MTHHTRITRWITAGVLAAIVLTSASAAFADRGGRHRFKGVNNGYPVQRVVIRDRSSSAGPAIAGLIGGFLLGTAISSNARPVIVQERRHYSRPVVEYRYYDPYDEIWYDSLEDCDMRHHHPRIIQVIDVRTGCQVRTLRYGDGGWHRTSGDWDRRGYGYEGDDD